MVPSLCDHRRQPRGRLHKTLYKSCSYAQLSSVTLALRLVLGGPIFAGRAVGVDDDCTSKTFKGNNNNNNNNNNDYYNYNNYN